MLHARIAACAFHTLLLVTPSKAMAFLSGIGRRGLGRRVELADGAEAQDTSEATRSLARPGIPQDDGVLRADVHAMPALGVSNRAAALVEVMQRKLTLIRRKHARIRYDMEVNALRGIVKDGAGTTLYDYLTEFKLTGIYVDVVFGTAGTNIEGKVRTVRRGIEASLLGETMTTAHALVSAAFFDKPISHSKTEVA